MEASVAWEKGDASLFPHLVRSERGQRWNTHLGDLEILRNTRRGK
jgi:hypothetical protein